VAAFCFFFVAAAATLLFGFAAEAFVAFRAGALPAGERLVAGFNRVDLAPARLRADEAVAPRLGDGREESFFTLLATGLLMSKDSVSEPTQTEIGAKKQGRSLTQVAC